MATVQRPQAAAQHPEPEGVSENAYSDNAIFLCHMTALSKVDSGKNPHQGHAASESECP